MTACELNGQANELVVDAMFAVRQWSFHTGETFGAIAKRYLHNMLNDIPEGTASIHFCCDRYDTDNLKASQHQHRYAKSEKAKVFEVSEQYIAPAPRDFFPISANKEALLNFLCMKWSQDEELKLLGSTCLYLGGGFKNVTESVVVSKGTVNEVAELQFTQNEADTRIILHSIYSFQKEGSERVVIYANDTDAIFSCVYYTSTLLKELPEMWVRTTQSSYLSIHQMASSLGPAQCRSLPFIHSLSGRDITSFPFFTSKKTWLRCSKEVEIPALEDFGEADVNSQGTVTTDVIQQARELLVAVYTKKDDDFKGSALGDLRVHKFLNNKSTLLKLLPPIEDAFLLHVKRAALATILDKTAHIPQPNLEPFTNFGWSLVEKLFPVPPTLPVWPDQMSKNISCGCLKGCNRNCSCSKKGIPCYIGCRCQGSERKCSRIKCIVTLDADSSDSDIDS